MKLIFAKKLCGPVMVILMVLLANPPCQAQRQYARNSIYFELLGNGIIYSVNYDRMFNDYLGARAGIMYFPAVPSLFSSIDNLVIMPLTLNYLIGSGSQKLELGAGIIFAQASVSTIFSDENKSGSGIAETITIGYRYQQRSGGFLFRIGFSPLIIGGEFYPWGGLSVGLSFN